MIELGDHAKMHIVPRMKKVIVTITPRRSRRAAPEFASPTLFSLGKEES